MTPEINLLAQTLEEKNENEASYLLREQIEALEGRTESEKQLYELNLLNWFLSLEPLPKLLAGLARNRLNWAKNEEDTEIGRKINQILREIQVNIKSTTSKTAEFNQRVQKGARAADPLFRAWRLNWIISLILTGFFLIGLGAIAALEFFWGITLF